MIEKKRRGKDARVGEKETRVGVGETGVGAPKETVVGAGVEKARRPRGRGLKPGESLTEEEAARVVENGLSTTPYRNNNFQQGTGVVPGVVSNVQEDGSFELTDAGKINAMLTKKNLTIAMWPRIDLMDEEQVRERISDYFELEASYGNKPTVSGLGLALNGVGRRRIYEIVSGKHENTRGITTHLPKLVTDIVKSAYQTIEVLWEDAMQNGRINPVSGIFLGKNHFGYQDRTEFVFSPGNNDSEYNAAQIRERLGITDSATLTDSDSD